ncbi:hypothetical protein [Bradyrhizobium sp. HKCCYLR20261]|uniref:hypothetical protein n=1 Tax=Bradyrhizobium sp. HKCCYLR20261 TaxID=3420760 RepID=UPI003EBB34A8
MSAPSGNLPRRFGIIEGGSVETWQDEHVAVRIHCMHHRRQMLGARIVARDEHQTFRRRPLPLLQQIERKASQRRAG